MVFCTIQGKKVIKRQAVQKDTFREKRLKRSTRVTELNSMDKDMPTHIESTLFL